MSYTLRHFPKLLYDLALRPIPKLAALFREYCHELGNDQKRVG